MNHLALKRSIKKAILIFALLPLAHLSFSQKVDSIKVVRHFSASLSATNNGISIVPSFSLGKPAAIFILSMRKNRFSFDPDLRFSLAGKPWSFLFWGRYHIATKGRFRMTAGTHLGLNYKTSILPINGDTSETTVARRYLAGELFPRYLLTKNISIGLYYLHSRGIDAGTIKQTNFLTFNTNFTNIKLSKKVFLNINPQVYYLQLDNHKGFYFTSNVTVAKRNFPLSISAIINKKLDSDIAGDDFVWNISLTYAFRKTFIEK